jgi:hypothetical protein
MAIITCNQGLGRPKSDEPGSATLQTLSPTPLPPTSPERGEPTPEHGPDEPTVRLSLTDDVSLRSSTWARVQLGIPLPED